MTAIDTLTAEEKALPADAEIEAAFATVMQRYMTVAEAAKQVGVRQSSVYDAVNDGRIAGMELFGQTICDRSSVAAYRPRRRPGSPGH